VTCVSEIVIYQVWYYEPFFCYYLCVIIDDHTPNHTKGAILASPWLLIVAAILLFAATRSFQFRFLPFVYGVPRPPVPSINVPDTTKLLMEVVVSLAFGVASLFVILSKRYLPSDKHFAYATAGIILGFWLR
jgi:hypothetical protein